MLIELEFAELHNALFLAGTNLNLKLDPSKRLGLRLMYDRTEKELLVSFNKRMAIIPSSNVSSMTPKDAEVIPEEKPKGMTTRTFGKVTVTTPTSLVGKLPQKSAQVSTPTSHVHDEGPGKVKN